MSVPSGIKTFKEFWPHYLREHSNPVSRTLHFIGTTLVIGMALTAILTQKWWVFLVMPVCGYLFAWIGHFMFERNRPATFKYPFFSLMADFVMLFKYLTGQLKADLQNRAAVELEIQRAQRS
jgi:hypothetical protein